jgi:hypothetical protein
VTLSPGCKVLLLVSLNPFNIHFESVSKVILLLRALFRPHPPPGEGEAAATAMIRWATTAGPQGEAAEWTARNRLTLCLGDEVSCPCSTSGEALVFFRGGSKGLLLHECRASCMRALMAHKLRLPCEQLALQRPQPWLHKRLAQPRRSRSDAAALQQSMWTLGELAEGGVGDQRLMRFPAESRS